MNAQTLVGNTKICSKVVVTIDQEKDLKNMRGI